VAHGDLHWLYCAIVRPILTHGALVWWSSVERSDVRTSTTITGGMRTAPTRALEVLLNCVPLDQLQIFMYEHFCIRDWATERCPILLMSSEQMLTRLQPSNFLKVVITERREWEDSKLVLKCKATMEKLAQINDIRLVWRDIRDMLPLPVETSSWVSSRILLVEDAWKRKSRQDTS